MSSPQFRVGLGADQHRLVPAPSSSGFSLILGGYQIPDATHLALEGNSDGDIIIHALCNALSTAIGGGSFGPTADKMCAQENKKDSHFYLEHFCREILQAGYQINNLSINVEAGQPKLEKHRAQIVASLAKLLNVYPDQIGLAFTSGDHLSAYARGEGMMAQVIVSLIKN